MKTHTTNFVNTFIEVSEDCPVTKAKIPEERNGKKTIASLEYEMIKQHPYQFTSDDVLFQVYVQRNNVAHKQLKEEKEKFFSKGQACFRASPLTKSYGWGVHSNEDAKIALYGIETKDYAAFLQDKTVQKVRAMRNRKK